MGKFTLTIAEATAAARKAYEEDRLSAQGPTPECRYRDLSGRPCAIGASLSWHRAVAWDGLRADETSVAAVAGRGLLASDNLNALRELQQAHDVWCSFPHSLADENVFRALIDLPPKAEGQ